MNLETNQIIMIVVIIILAVSLGFMANIYYKLNKVMGTDEGYSNFRTGERITPYILDSNNPKNIIETYKGTSMNGVKTDKRYFTNTLEHDRFAMNNKVMEHYTPKDLMKRNLGMLTESKM